MKSTRKDIEIKLDVEGAPDCASPYMGGKTISPREVELSYDGEGKFYFARVTGIPYKKDGTLSASQPVTHSYSRHSMLRWLIELAEEHNPVPFEIWYQFGIRVPGQDAVDAQELRHGTDMRREAEERLQRHRDSHPDAELVMRRVTHGLWATVETPKEN